MTGCARARVCMRARVRAVRACVRVRAGGRARACGRVLAPVRACGQLLCGGKFKKLKTFDLEKAAPLLEVHTAWHRA